MVGARVRARLRAGYYWLHNRGHYLRWCWQPSYRTAILQEFLGRNRAAGAAFHALAVRALDGAPLAGLDLVSYHILLQAAYGSRKLEEEATEMNRQATGGGAPVPAPLDVLLVIKDVQQRTLVDIFDARTVSALAYGCGYPLVESWIAAHPDEYTRGVFNGFVLAKPESPTELLKAVQVLVNRIDAAVCYYPYGYEQHDVQEIVDMLAWMREILKDDGSEMDRIKLAFRFPVLFAAIRVWLHNNAASLKVSEEVAALMQCVEHLQTRDGAGH